MSFETTSAHDTGTAIITLAGELDSMSAPRFRADIEQLIADADELDRLVLDMSGLTYMSSAGLRGLVFARQKMRGDVQIVLVGVAASVEQTIRMVGFHHSVTFSDAVPGAIPEAS